MVTTDPGLPNALVTSGDGAAAELALHTWARQSFVRLSALSNQGFGVQLSGHATQVTNAVIEDTQPFSEAVETTGVDRNSGQSANGMRRGQLKGPHIGLPALDDGGDTAGIKRDGPRDCRRRTAKPAQRGALDRRVRTLGLSQLMNVVVRRTQGPGVFNSVAPTSPVADPLWNVDYPLRQQSPRVRGWNHRSGFRFRLGQQ